MFEPIPQDPLAADQFPDATKMTAPTSVDPMPSPLITPQVSPSPAPPIPDTAAPRDTTPIDLTFGASLPNESQAFAAYHALKQERRAPGTVPPERLPQLRSTLRDYATTARAYNRPLFAEQTTIQRADQTRQTQKLLAGLDKLPEALTPEQHKALDERAKLHPDPDAYRARQINRTLLDMAYGKKVKPESYELARDHYAKTVLGSTTPLDDKAFYTAMQNRAQKQQGAEKLLGEKLESLLSDTVAGKQWNIKTYLGEVKDAIPDLDDTTLENIEAELRLKRRQFSDLKRTVTPIAQALTAFTMARGDRADAIKDTPGSAPVPQSEFEAAQRFMALTPEQRTMTAAMIAQSLETMPEDQRPAPLRALLGAGRTTYNMVQGVADFIAANYYAGKQFVKDDARPEGDATVQGAAQLRQLSTKAAADMLRPSDGFLAKVGILATTQLPYTAAAATGAGTVLMGASMAGDSYVQARLDTPNADPGKQLMAATVSGAAQAVVERASFKALTGAVKGTGKLTGFLTGKYGTESALRLAGVTNNLARFAAGYTIGTAAITATEYTEEIAQEFIDTGLQDLATSMSGMDPDTDYLALWKSWNPTGEKGMKTILALLPLAIIGGLGAGYHHFKHGEILLENRAALTAMGIAPERIDSIVKNPDVQQSVEQFREAFQEGATQKIEEAEAKRRADAAAAFTEYLEGTQELARAAGYEIIAEDTDFAEMGGEPRFILRLPEQEPQLFATQEEAETALKESIEQQIQQAHDIALESLTGSMVDFLKQEYASGQNVQVSQKDFAGDFDTLIKKGLATREAVQARLELFALERGQSLPQLQADIANGLDVRIMARAYAKQLTGGATKYFVDLFQGADPIAAAEDFSETHWQHLLTSGLIDAPTALGWLKEAQEKTGYAYLPASLTAATYTPAQRATLIEGLSKASVQYLLGQSTSDQLPEGFRGWVEKMIIAMGQAWTWAKQLLASKKLREAIEENQLPARFVAELADSVGLNDAARQRRAEKEAEAQAMAEFMGDFTPLSTYAKGKLLHPAKAREMESPFAGELQRIYDHFVSRERKVKHTKKGVKVDYTERVAAANKFFAPIDEAVNLDDLRDRMTQEGFPNMETISDMLLQIEEVLSIENYEIYATHSSLAAQNAAAGYGPTFSMAADPSNQSDMSEPTFALSSNVKNQLELDFSSAPITSEKAAPSPFSNQPKATAAPQSLDDVGETLNVRKNRQFQAPANIAETDYASQPLSKLWPKKEVDQIEDIQIAAIAHTLRDALPSKPQKGYKLARWIDAVKNARQILANVAETGAEAMMVQMTRLGNISQANALVNKMRLLTTLPRNQWDRVGNVEWWPDAYTYERNADGSMSNRKLHVPYAATSIDSKRVTATSLSELQELVADAIGGADGKKQTKPITFEVRTDRKSFFINKKGDPLRRRLATFESAELAFKKIKEEPADLIAAWEDIKSKQNVRQTDTRSDINRLRDAPDWRNGKDISPEEFASTFGFRGIAFGNWVNQGANSKERQGMINLAYESFLDLANIIGVPAKAIGLNGSLGMSFGADGSGWASAHYAPDDRVINLTKTRGAGSLAHEFFHALDHYFQRTRRNATTFATEQAGEHYIHAITGEVITKANHQRRISSVNPRTQEDVKNFTRLEGIRPEMEERFKALVEALNKSPMAARVMQLDKSTSKDYWSSIIEQAARSFENYVIEKLAKAGHTNDYLANVTKVEDFQKDPSVYPYLLAEELAPIEQAFDEFFNTMQVRETPQGLQTYSLSALTGSPLHTLLAQKAAAGPTERAEIMEGIRTRLQGLEYKLEARGSGELTEMEKQLLGWRARTDLTPEQRERLRIEDALAQVKAVLAAVPVEIRAKIAVPMARILDAQTDKTTVNAFAELIENLDEELEFHLRGEYTEAISRILDIAQPTMSESRQSKGKLIVETNRLIKAVNEIMELDALNLALEISTTEATIAELERELEGIAEEDAETRAKVQQRLDAIQERQHLLYHFGGIGSKDSRELAQSHKILRDIYTRGRVARKILDEERRQWIARMRNDVRNSLDAPRGVSGPAHARATEKKNLTKGYAWNLMNIHNLLQVLFPYSQFAAEASQRLITAQRNVTRARLAAKDRFNGFMDATFGTKNQRERNKIIRQLHKRRNWKAQVSEVNQTRLEKLTIDQAQRILAGTMKPGWETERDTMILLQQAWRDYLAKNKRAREATQFIEITRVVSRKPAVALRLSDMDALYVLQLARQEEYIPALTTYGYTKEVIEQIREEIDPRALEFMRFYAREYDENWATMNPTFQSLYHMDMPRIRNYAPGAFENMKSGPAMSGDPMGDAAPMGAMNFGATKNRRAHRSRPKQYSAHAVYMGHVDRSTYWVEFAEIARDMGMIFRETETRRALEVKHGPEAAAELLTWLDNIANDGAVDAAARLASNTIAQNVAAGQAIAGLSFNFSVPFKQFGAALGSLWYLSPAQALKAFARVIYKPQTFAHVWKSEAIQQRIREGFSPEDRAMLDAAEISPSELYRLHSIARLPITYADAAFTTISGVIAYDHHYTESRAGGMDHARAHDAAMAFMDRVVFLTAQPADTQTKSNWEINAKGFAKLLILFKSDLRKQIGLMLADLAKVKAGNLSKAKLAERFLTQWIAYGLMAYIGGAAFRAIAQDDEDDRPVWDWKELLAAMLIGPVEGAGLIGSVIQAAIKLTTGTRNFTNSNNPLADSLTRTVATMKDFDPFSMDTVKLLATITQLGSVKNPLFALIPAAMRGADQIANMVDNLNESEEERLTRLSREYSTQQRDAAKAEAKRIDALAESEVPLDQLAEEDRKKVEKKRTTAQEEDTVPPLIQSLKKMSERTRTEKINYILEGLPDEDERASFKALLRTHGIDVPEP